MKIGFWKCIVAHEVSNIKRQRSRDKVTAIKREDSTEADGLGETSLNPISSPPIMYCYRALQHLCSWGSSNLPKHSIPLKGLDGGGGGWR